MRAPPHHRIPILLAGAGVALAVAAAGAAGGEPSSAPPAAPAATVPADATPIARPAPPPRRERVRSKALRAGLPARIRIPAIGVDARVIGLRLDRDGALEVPRSWGDVGWYVHSPRPGEPGPAVMAGHVDSTSGPAVFYRLGALRPGATIQIARRDGTAVRFRVRRVERWPKAHFPTRRVYATTLRPTLRLITCGGGFDRDTGHYLDNTIVFAARS
jgi:hypothetical protein